MGIYITNIEMPQDEEMLCVNIYPDGKVCINLDLECKRIATAVPVPPHRRLGDLDALAAQCDDLFGCVWLSDIQDAPTIIPPEEGE